MYFDMLLYTRKDKSVEMDKNIIAPYPLLDVASVKKLLRNDFNTCCQIQPYTLLFQLLHHVAEAAGYVKVLNLIKIF